MSDLAVSSPPTWSNLARRVSPFEDIDNWLLSSPRRRTAQATRRGRQLTGGRRCAHGRAASIWALSDSSVASSKGLPTNCTDTGSPS
jgi:hypothetical protein